MRILLYSHAFWPSLGGIERVSQLLARSFHALGNHVDLVTDTPSSDSAWDEIQPYSIWRRPSLLQLFALVARADVVHANGASLVPMLPALLLRRPAIWTHANWQLLSIDGLGWNDGAPTPMDPAASLAFYRCRLPPLPFARRALLFHLRGWMSGRLNANVAISQWMDRRQPLPLQQVIPNPVFLPAYPWSDPSSRPVHLLFLGRLVSEKGLDVLLRAMAELAAGDPPLRPLLLVVGDGPMQGPWQRAATALGVDGQVSFLGALSGQPLLAALDRCRIGVVPSVWEEPMGLVALEFLAAGLIPVVSIRGGLAENVGTIGRSFANGDATALAFVLRELLMDPPAFCVAESMALLSAFSPARIAARYATLYFSLISR